MAKTYTLPAEEIRGDQLLYEINQAITGTLDVDEFYVDPPLTLVITDDTLDGESATIQAVIDSHVPQYPFFQKEIDYQNTTVDALDRLKASAHWSMTPAEIATAVQTEIDGWASLADAQGSLRKWLPYLIAGVVWLVGRTHQREV